MAHRLDAAERFELLFGAHAVLAGRLQIAVDEFDGLGQTARRNCFPHFAKAACPQSLDELVTGDRFGLTFNPDSHERENRIRKKEGGQRESAYFLLWPVSTDAGCSET